MAALSMLTKLLCLLEIFYQFLKAYIFGVCCLIRQITQRHIVPTGIPDAPGKVAIVTGGASGIGFNIARKLANKKLHVVIAGPCHQENERAVQAIQGSVQAAKVQALQLDLASFKSVERFVAEFLALKLPLHILINNAGVMFAPYEVTDDGLERQTQINYSGHFYLTQLLLEKLQESGEDNFWSRIVNVSSCMHGAGSMDMSSLSAFGRRRESWYYYSGHAAYCDSKLAIVMTTYRLNSILRKENSRVSVNVVHPGIVKSGLTRYLLQIIQFLDVFDAFRKTTDQGADVSVFAALSPAIEGHSGRYYDNCKEERSKNVSYSKELQRKLWERTSEIVEQKKTR